MEFKHFYLLNVIILNVLFPVQNKKDGLASKSRSCPCNIGLCPTTDNDRENNLTSRYHPANQLALVFSRVGQTGAPGENPFGRQLQIVTLYSLCHWRSTLQGCLWVKIGVGDAQLL